MPCLDHSAQIRKQGADPGTSNERDDGIDP